MGFRWRRPMSRTGSASSSTIAWRPRRISTANRYWRSAAATAAEPRTSCARCTWPPARAWTSTRPASPFAEGDMICTGLISCAATPKVCRLPTNPPTRVINVEASRALPSAYRFLAEVVRAAPGRALPLRRLPRPQRMSRLGGSTGRHPDAAGFGTCHQSGGSARDGEKFAAVNAPDRSPDAGVYAPLRPPIRRCARHGALPTSRTGKSSTGCIASPRIERRRQAIA